MIFNTKIYLWAIHTVDQLGSVIMGWGLFIIALTWFGIRNKNKLAWNSSWIGGTPTLLFSALKIIHRYGIYDRCRLFYSW